MSSLLHRAANLRFGIIAQAIRCYLLQLMCVMAALSPLGLRADGIDLPPRSKVADLVSAEQLERQAALQYDQMRERAASQRALAPEGHPNLVRLQNIAKRLLPHAARYNDRASQWRWEVSLIGSQALNAFAMPGGKIAFYTGIIERLQLSDDEIAFIMGHEIAHALREHGRERQSKAMIAQGLTIGASILRK
jgi:Zn-dependent protease with chaperone function